MEDKKKVGVHFWRFFFLGVVSLGCFSLLISICLHECGSRGGFETSSFISDKQEGERGEESKPEYREQGNLPPLRLVFWNVRNYIIEDNEEGEKPKPEKQRAKIAHDLASLQADIITLAEVGSEEGMEDLAANLAALGQYYPYRETVIRGAGMKGLVLLSKYAVTGNRSRDIVPLDPLREGIMMRGILDVILELENGSQLQLLVVHLKSKHGNQEDNERIRRGEAAELKKHIQSSIARNPSRPLILCGDLNDSPVSPALKTLSGKREDPDKLKVLKPMDDRKETWTHYYKHEDIYSRIDYVLVYQGHNNKGKLTGGVRRDRYASFIPSDPGWYEVSDHRPVVCDINRS